MELEDDQPIMSWDAGKEGGQQVKYRRSPPCSRRTSDITRKRVKLQIARVVTSAVLKLTAGLDGYQTRRREGLNPILAAADSYSNIEPCDFNRGLLQARNLFLNRKLNGTEINAKIDLKQSKLNRGRVTSSGGDKNKGRDDIQSSAAHISRRNQTKRDRQDSRV